jgi:hypothetical protein
MDPNPMISCPDVDQNLWRYIDRELSASALAAISSHLRACESCQGLYHERARDASHYRMVFVDSPFGEPFVVKLRRRLRQETPAPPGGSSARGRGTGILSLRHRKVRRALAVAAMLILIPVVILIGLLQKSNERRWLGSFVAQGQGKVSLISEDGTRDESVSLPLVARGRYGPGDGIVVPKDVEVALDYGQSQITLHGPAFLRLDPNSSRDQFLAYLEKGKLDAGVAPLTLPQQAFVIRTEHAVASVVGTRFTVEALEEETLLAVQEGSVKFQWARARPGTYVKPVEAGETFRMRWDGQVEQVVEDVAGEAGTEVPISTPAPDSASARAPSETPEREAGALEDPGAVTPSGAPTAAQPPSPEKGPVKSGDDVPNADLDQPVTR